MGFRLGTASLLLALTFLPAVALAEVSDADRATARALALEGQEALDRKEFAAALDRFGRADAIIHAPTLLLGVARAQVGLGKWVAAQESYTRILREGAPEGSPEPFFAAIEDARKELDALAPRIPQVLITVRGADAPSVTIDGAPVPSAALGVKRPVDPGAHVIRAQAHGFEAVEEKVTLAEGASRTVALALTPSAPSTAASSPGTTRVTPPPPPDPMSPTAGSSRTLLGIAALGLGGIGLGVGAVTGLLAAGKHSDLSAQCASGTCDPSLQGDVDSYRTMGTISTIGFVVGAVSAGAGAYLFLTAPKAPKRAGAWVTPVIGLGYAGATGRF